MSDMDDWDDGPIVGRNDSPEPHCYQCCDSGCVECDPHMEGPRLPWWWFSADLDVRGYGVEDDTGWPVHYQTRVDLLPRKFGLEGDPF